MLKRIVLLTLSVWLMIAGGLAAQAAPCHFQAKEAQPPAAEHAHCDMMAAAPADTPADSLPEVPAPDGICCCPAVMAALAAPALPSGETTLFRLPAGFPLEADAPSQTLIPEPPPPKA